MIKKNIDQLYSWNSQWPVSQYSYLVTFRKKQGNLRQKSKKSAVNCLKNVLSFNQSTVNRILEKKKRPQWGSSFGGQRGFPRDSFESMKVLLWWCRLNILDWKILRNIYQKHNWCLRSKREITKKTRWKRHGGHRGTLCMHREKDLQHSQHNSKTNGPFRARFQTVITWRTFAGLPLKAHLWGKLFPFKKSERLCID